MTKIDHLDPNIIYRSIDENNLDFDPLIDDNYVSELWELDKAQIRQKHWLYRGLRQHKYLPETIEQHYSLDGAKPVALNELIQVLGEFHRIVS